MPSELFSLLETMNSGRDLARLEALFEELRHAVVDNEGSGVLTIKLKIGSGKKNLNPVVCHSTVTLPQEEPQKAIFYFDEDKRLVRDDPRQMKLFNKTPKVVTIPREEVPQADQAHNA